MSLVGLGVKKKPVSRLRWESRWHGGGTLLHIIGLSVHGMESISSHSYAVNEIVQEHCETL